MPERRQARAVACAPDLSALLRAVEFRDLEAGLSCVMGIGSEAWDRLFGSPRPAELHPFREFAAARAMRSRPPGDLLFHIRAKRMDLCFELATQIMARVGGAVDAPSTRCTAFATSTTATSSASSTAPRTRAGRRCSTPC